jgi:hypothetical protein
MPDDTAHPELLSDFIETGTERFRLLRATVTGGYPAGFEPADEPQPAGNPDEDVWTNGTFRATPAVVADERGW